MLNIHSLISCDNFMQGFKRASLVRIYVLAFVSVGTKKKKKYARGFSTGRFKFADKWRLNFISHKM